MGTQRDREDEDVVSEAFYPPFLCLPAALFSLTKVEDRHQELGHSHLFIHTHIHTHTPAD